MAVLGTGMGLTSAPATEAIMGVVPKAKAGVGSAVKDATRLLGGTLGVAVIGSIYASFYASRDRKSTRLNSSHTVISYAVFCLKRAPIHRDLHSFPTRRSSDLDGGPRNRHGPDERARDRGDHGRRTQGEGRRRLGRQGRHPAARRHAWRRGHRQHLRLVLCQPRSEEHTSELQSHSDLVCRLLLETCSHPSRSTLFPYTTLFRSRWRSSEPAWA